MSTKFSEVSPLPVLEKSPVNLTFTNLGKGRASVEGQVEFVFAMNCDRCLKPVREKLRLQFSREVHAPDAVSELLHLTNVGAVIFQFALLLSLLPLEDLFLGQINIQASERFPLISVMVSETHMYNSVMFRFP